MWRILEVVGGEHPCCFSSTALLVQCLRNTGVRSQDAARSTPTRDQRVWNVSVSSCSHTAKRCRTSTRDAPAAGVEPATVCLTVKGQGSNSLFLSLSWRQTTRTQFCSFKVPRLLGREGAEFKTGVAYTQQNWPQAAREASHHLSNLLESSYFWPPETEFRVSFLFELVFPEMLIHCRKKQAVQGEQEENS